MIYMKQDRIFWCGDHLYEFVIVKRRWWQFWKPKSWIEKRIIINSFKPQMIEFTGQSKP